MGLILGTSDFMCSLPHVIFILPYSITFVTHNDSVAFISSLWAIQKWAMGQDLAIYHSF